MGPGVNESRVFFRANRPVYESMRIARVWARFDGIAGLRRFVCIFTRLLVLWCKSMHFYGEFARAIFDAICRTCAWWVLRATQYVSCFWRFCLFDGRVGWPKWPFRLGGRCVLRFFDAISHVWRASISHAICGILPRFGVGVACVSFSACGRL